jgi:hypothetical protein
VIVGWQVQCLKADHGAEIIPFSPMLVALEVEHLQKLEWLCLNGGCSTRVIAAMGKVTVHCWLRLS